MTLIELCAGSAAVSLRWLSSTGRPPLAYQGGKRGYADQILAAMGLQPGGGRGAEIILCEPGPWGEAWDLWRTAEGRADTIDRLRAWAEEDPRALWERLRKAPVPSEVAERVATWAVLQWWSYAHKPVCADGANWTPGSFHPDAYASEYAKGYVAPDGRTWARRDQRLPDLIDNLQTLPDLSCLTVVRCSALDVSPVPGAVVYIDPPYQGTTCAYGHSLSRAEVLALVERWRAAGAALVCVSEAEPLGLPGWHAHTLGGPAGFGRTWSKQRREVLTLSQPAAGQLGLGVCA